MKIFAALLLTIFFMPQLIADASIDTVDKKKTILLTAPGTLSGGSQSTQKSSKSVAPPSQQYRYAGDRYEDSMRKFPQFGQQFGHNNPWTQQGYAPSMPAQRGQGNRSSNDYNNPWHLGGPQPQMGPENYQQPYNMAPNGQYGQFNQMDNMYPNPSEGIYRDTNPAANFPLMNGMLPGGMGNGFPFSNFSAPFSSFGQF